MGANGNLFLAIGLWLTIFWHCQAFAGAEQHLGSSALTTIVQVEASSSDGAEPDDNSFDDGASDVPFFGYDDDAANVRVLQNGISNEAIVEQGHLSGGCEECVIDAVQSGAFNAASILQDGEDNSATIVQDGAFNQLTGVQQGDDNALAVEQFNSGNFAAVRQFGDNRRITVSQPGGGFIDITQD